MRRWLSAVTQWPRATLVVVGCITILSAAQLPRLAIETDGHAFVERNHPVVREDATLRGRFGLRDPLLIALDSGGPDRAFSSDALLRVVSVTEAVRGASGIDPESVASVGRLQRIERRNGAPVARRLWSPAPGGHQPHGELLRYLSGSTAAAGLRLARCGRD